MKITKHAQSCFLIETGEGSRILIDPGTYVFGGKENFKAEDFTGIDILLITHQHSDHFDIGNVVKIVADNSQIQIFTTTAVRTVLREKGIKAEVLGNKGKREDLGIAGDIDITAILSQHGPQNGILPSGDKVPVVMGFVIKGKDGTSFYTPGDTIKLNASADVIATPICGTVVMDIEDARGQLLKIEPKISIPIHYDNPAYPVKVDDFMEAMEGTNIEVKVLADNETLEVLG